MALMFRGEAGNSKGQPVPGQTAGGGICNCWGGPLTRDLQTRQARLPPLQAGIFCTEGTGVQAFCLCTLENNFKNPHPLHTHTHPIKLTSKIVDRLK